MGIGIQMVYMCHVMWSILQGGAYLDPPYFIQVGTPMQDHFVFELVYTIYWDAGAAVG